MVVENRCLLVITGAFELTGGIAASTRLAIYTLLDAGYELDIFALNEGNEAYKKYEKLPKVHFYAANKNKLRFTSAIWLSLLRNRYNFAFSDHINIASILAPAAFLRIIRYTVRLHLIEAVPPNPDFQGRLGMRFAWRLHASEYTKQEILKSFPDLKIDVVPLSLEPDQSLDAILDFTPDDLVLQAMDGETRKLQSRIILLVGRMASGEQYKGQDILIQAMPLILAECPQTQLVLVGSGDDMPRIRGYAQAQPANVQRQIFLPGFVNNEQLNKLYRACYLFAMPSRGEGFGVVYLEAMRWGKPCIASRMDAAQYIVRDRETGLLVDDPNNFKDVAASILQLLNDPQSSTKYGSNGFALVKTTFSFENFSQLFLASLNNI